MSRGPQNPTTTTGTWSPNTQRAPGAKSSELIVSRDGYSDDGADGPQIGVPTGAHEGSTVALPYPEATYWGRLGNRIFKVTAAVTGGRTADAIGYFADTTSLTADMI